MNLELKTNPDIGRPDVPQIKEKSEGLEIRWDDNEIHFFDSFWLRNCCYCEICGSSYTGSRFLQPCDVPMEIALKQVNATDLSTLKITWEDGHQSEYDYDWLKHNAYVNSGRGENWYQPFLWDASISENPPAVDFADAGSSDIGLLEMLRNLRDFGFVIVKDGPTEAGAIESVAGLIGEMGEAAYDRVFELKPEKTAHTLGNSMHPVPPHTDEAYLNTPTGILVLYCNQPARDGGESVLVDGFHLAEQLKQSNPEAFHILSTQPQSFHRIVLDEGIYHWTRARVLTLDEYQNVVGFRFHTRTNAPLNTDPETAKLIHKANAALCRLMLDETNQACFKLGPGDTVMFDNHRVMHSRLGFSDLNRHLQICNISRENFHQKLRLTAYKLGYFDEADQILPAGVSC